MHTLRRRLYPLAVCGSVAIIAGCGGGAPYTAPAAAAARVVLQTARSWILPEAKSADLLYVSNYKNGTVGVYSYPGGTLVGTLAGLKMPQGECADASGDVFITTKRRILEYAHGGTEPIATLTDSVYFPLACSVDPSTGNLAVSNLDSRKRGGAGSIAIYRNAQGKPQNYEGLQYYISCAYDDNGNLFADGEANSDEILTELPKSGATFKTIRFRLYGLGDIQWDGKYLANEIGETGSSSISRLHISDFRARVAGTTTLDRAGNAFIIDRMRVILAVSGGVDFFEYPSGKGPTKMIGDANGANGVVISDARRGAP